MVTLKDSLSPKRSASILALEYITAPPSAVIAEGTVAARVQAWNDVINSPPRPDYGPDGPSPPSRRNIKTRDGSDRGTRSSFGRRSEGSFAKPAGRNRRLAPEGIKRDGLPPVGDPSLKAVGAIGGLSSGGTDIEEYRLAGLIGEMTSIELLNATRGRGWSLDSADAFSSSKSTNKKTERHLHEDRKQKKLEKRHSVVNTTTPKSGQKNKSSHSSPKSVIEELGNTIDEALEHHTRNATKDSATADQIEEALDHHLRSSPKHEDRVTEIIDQHKEQAQNESMKEEYQNKRHDHFQEEKSHSRVKSRPSGKVSPQISLTAKTAAGGLAMANPTPPLNPDMEELENASSSASPSSRDYLLANTLIRRRSKKRRASAIFSRGTMTHDYPMEELSVRRPRRLTADSAISISRQNAEAQRPDDQRTTASTPGHMSTTITRKGPHNKKYSRRQSVTFRSSTFHDDPEEPPSEKEATVDANGDARQVARRDETSAAVQSSADEDASPVIERASDSLSFTNIEAREEGQQLITEIPTSVTESETEIIDSTRPQSPRPSISSAISANASTPKAWPFRWRLALVDKSETQRSRSSAHSSPELRDAIQQTISCRGSKGVGTESDLRIFSAATSGEVTLNGNDNNRRNLSRSQSDSHLSRKPMTALRIEELEAFQTGHEDDQPPPLEVRSASLTTKNTRLRSATVSRRASHHSSRREVAPSKTSSATDQTTTPVKSPFIDIGSRKQPTTAYEQISDETAKPEAISRSPRESFSHKAQCNTTNAEEPCDTQTRRQSEMAVVDRASNKATINALSRRSSRRENTGSTIGSSRTFRTRGHRGIHAITIKVQIRTADQELETTEQGHQDTVVVKAQLGQRRGVSMESENTE
jgi:hypothetical protein